MATKSLGKRARTLHSLSQTLLKDMVSRKVTLSHLWIIMPPLRRGGMLRSVEKRSGK